jgi:translocation and assembly module TamA
MKCFWAAALALLGLPTFLNAQTLSAPAPPRQAPSVSPLGTPSGATPSGVAFDVSIEAPEEIKQLLQQHLELLRYRALADLSDSELDRLLSAAEQNTRELVATLGYFSPEIHIDRLALSSAASNRQARLSVAPGAPARVIEVQVNFSGPIASDPAASVQRQQISANWLLRQGMRFTQVEWDAAKQQALRQLISQRYPAGHLGSTLADIDPNTQQARLHVTLESGPAYQLGALAMEGLQRYDADWVTRLARLEPGTPYSQTQLAAAQQRLADSGYFDSVIVSLDSSANPLAAPVLIKLHEAQLQKIVFGIGASTDSGPRLSVEHTHHKVPGIGWRAVSKLRLDRDNQSIGTELTSAPDADNWRWAGSILLQNQRLGTLDVTSQQLRAGRSKNDEHIERNLYLQYDRADTLVAASMQPVIAQAVSANYAFTLRHFDRMPFPSGGWGWGAEVGGGTTLGSQHDPYARLLTRWQGFWPLSAGRIALRASAGAVLAKDSINLPSTQLFLTGGDNSVRGYGLRDIGVTLPDGSITAGRYLALGSVEWQRPIRINGRASDWESTVFVDSGAVANQTTDLHAKVGVGVGARWNSPVGPLQIALAYGVAVQHFRLHLTLGFAF